MKLNYIKPETQAYATLSAQVLAGSSDAEYTEVGIEDIIDGGTIDLD